MNAPAAAAAERIAAAFAGHGKRAALMPYLMGGHPDVTTSIAAAGAAAAAGADLLELGVPFSDPLADGPVIHAAATEALAAGVTPDDVLGVCEEASRQLPVVLMVYANVVLAAGVEEYATRAAEAGASGLIVPDLPARRGGRAARSLRRSAGSRWCRSWRPPPPRSGSRRSARTPAASSTPCR